MAKKVEHTTSLVVLETDVVIDGIVRPYPRIQKTFYEPSLTRASEAAHTDLKKLVERFRISGQAPPPQNFGDVSSLPQSRLEAMERMQDGLDAFAGLPLKVRQAVGHDPRQLEAWIAGNPQLAFEFGLMAETYTPPSPENPTSSGTDEGKKAKPAEPA